MEDESLEVVLVIDPNGRTLSVVCRPESMEGGENHAH